ncbi:hypothetical protein ABU614_13730 [Lysobacter firmicutimachus]|uniref:Uncharacterized protein n=1 Tax=Lysobacter firmicutimachus TaxID=1792846 RepID=A0AAU8MQT1_9GAMM
MIQVLSTLESMRKRPEMFLDMALARDVAIALELLTTAMHQGVDSLTVQKRAGLRVIGADANWLYSHDDAPAFHFDRLIDLDGIPNSFRGEVLLTAFATFYAIVENGKVLYKSSPSVADEVLREVGGAAGPFSVVFHANATSEGAAPQP